MPTTSGTMAMAYEEFEKLRLRLKQTPRPKLKGLDHFTESVIFNYAKQYITPHFITEEHENDNEKN